MEHLRGSNPLVIVMYGKFQLVDNTIALWVVVLVASETNSFANKIELNSD
jgi:hypothetical protein